VDQFGTQIILPPEIAVIGKEGPQVRGKIINVISLPSEEWETGKIYLCTEGMPACPAFMNVQANSMLINATRRIYSFI